MAYNALKHPAACDCSVCWAKNYCDALKLFPDPQPRHTPPFPVNYKDCQDMGFFARNMRRLIALSGRKS